MLKVVLAYDGSAQAGKALECLAWWPAADLAVTLVTAVRSGPVLNALGDAVSGDPEDYQRALQTLREVAEALAARGIATTVRVEFGDPRDLIVNIAGEVEAELIITGSRGLNLAKRMLLGSVSSDVMQNAPCAVLLVR